MKILVKKMLVSPVNSARNPLGWTQTQLKKEISFIQTFTKYVIVMEIATRLDANTTEKGNQLYPNVH